jgi:hypothetical protein
MPTPDDATHQHTAGSPRNNGTAPDDERGTSFWTRQARDWTPQDCYDMLFVPEENGQDPPEVRTREFWTDPRHAPLLARIREDPLLWKATRQRARALHMHFDLEAFLDAWLLQYGETPRDRTTPAAPRAPTVPWTGELPDSDYTNALALVREYGVDLRYCHPWTHWLLWTGTPTTSAR